MFPYGQRTEPTARTSRRLSMVIAREPANRSRQGPLTLPSRRPRKQQDVGLPLVIPLSMEMVDVLALISTGELEFMASRGE